MFPERSSPDALRVTGKTIEDFENGEDVVTVVNKFNEFFAMDGSDSKSRCIIGHNIFNFDKKFLHAMWESADSVFPADMWLDTLTLTKAYLKSMGPIKKGVKTNLEAACDMFGVKKASAFHSAKTDSRYNFFLYEKMLEARVNMIQHIKIFPHAVKETEEERNSLMEEAFDEQE
jgi:DNA polymerase III epsilon subunit-like protein